MLLSYNGRAAEFDPGNQKFFAVNHLETASLVDVRNRVEGRSSPNRRIFPGQATNPASTSKSASPGVPDPSWKFTRSRYLHRLVLNVANYCNLDCVYCYAQGGDYGGPREKMTLEVGKLAFDRYFELYHEIATVQFFGGEPLLNWPLIEQLCNYGSARANALGRPQPTYTLITNGTVMNDEIIEMIRRHDLKVTVSIDGPPEVNDRLRISRNAMPGGITSTIEKNIQLLKKETGQPLQTEGTYTSLHVEMGCTINDVLDYVRSELGVNQIHMPINCVEDSQTKDRYAVRPEHSAEVNAAYADAVARTIWSLVRDPVGELCILRSALDIIDSLLATEKAEEPFLCPAGNGTLAIDSNGDVYPCFLFYRMPQFRIGGLVDPRKGPLEENKQSDFLSFIRPTVIPHVRSSWAKKFFRGCAGGNYFKNGHHGVVSDIEVSLIEEMVSSAVVELAHLAKDKESWDYLPHAVNMFKLYMMAPDV